MNKHEQITLSSVGDYASVNTCSCCSNNIIHVNFYNSTLRLTREYFREYVTMLNDAMIKIDDTGEFCETLGSMSRFYSYLHGCEFESEG